MQYPTSLLGRLAKKTLAVLHVSSEIDHHSETTWTARARLLRQCVTSFDDELNISDVACEVVLPSDVSDSVCKAVVPC